MTEEPIDIFGNEAAQLRDLMANLRKRPINTWLSAARKLHNVTTSLANRLSSPQLRSKLAEFLEEDAVNKLANEIDELNDATFRLVRLGNHIRHSPPSSVDENDAQSIKINECKKAVTQGAKELLHSLTDAFLGGGNLGEQDLFSLKKALRSEIDIYRWSAIARKIHRQILRNNSEFEERLSKTIRRKRLVDESLLDRKSIHYVDYGPERDAAYELQRAIREEIGALDELYKRMSNLLSWCSLLIIVNKDFEERKDSPSEGLSIEAADKATRYYADYRTNILKSLDYYLQSLEEAIAITAKQTTLS